VLLSRVLGYVREAVLAYQVGAGRATDAFYAAFQLPDLLNYFLAGGALTIAFLPFYTRCLSQGESARAQRLFSTVLGTLGGLALLAALLLWWWAEPLVAFQFPRFDAEAQALTVRLTRIVLPAQVFFITGGILNAVLLAHGRFQAQALAPLLYNGVIILAGLSLGGGVMGVEGFAWGALAGAFLGPFLIPLLQVGRHVRLRLRLAPRDGDFLRYLAVAAPLMLGVTLLTVDEWYERWFGALQEAGTVAYLGYARRLMQVPVAVVGQALATAALPFLARMFAEKRFEDLNRTLLKTLQAGLVLAVLGAAFFCACAQPIVELIYRRGAFSGEDATRVAAILSVLALAVPAWVTQQIAARAFYARGDTWRPMLLGTFVALAAVPIYLHLGRVYGAVGLAAAGVIGMSGGALVTLLLARRLHGAPVLGALAGTFARSAVIALAAGAAAFWARGEEAADATAALLALARAGGAFCLVTLLLVRFLGDAAMREALARGLRWLRRRRAAA